MSDLKLVSDMNAASDFAMTEAAVQLADNFEQLHRQRVIPKYFSAPIYLMWELTSKCPLNCLHCYNESPRKVVEISHDAALKIAKEIVDLRIFSTCLTGGEPSLRKDFFEIASYLRDNGAPIGTITSGWPIDEKKADEYAKIFNVVQVSLDGPNAEVHDTMRGTKGSFERAVRAIKLFRERGIQQVDVAFSITKYNIDSFPEVIKFCSDVGVNELRTQPIMLAGRAAKDSIEVSDQEYGMVKSIIYEYNKNPESSSALKVSWGEPLPHILFGRKAKFSIFLRITAEGKYSVSPYLPFTIGTVQEYGLKEIWDKSFRTCWSHPLIEQNIKDVESIADVKEVVEKFGFEEIDILKADLAE